MNDDNPSQETMNNWHDDPSNWKLGVFSYINDDKRLFPPKRYGFGWTVNFANPNSIMMLVGITLLGLLIGVLLRS